MSGEKISLELLGTRVLTLTDRVHGIELEIRDLKIRLPQLRRRSAHSSSDFRCRRSE
jgi:hypothetical protein